MTSSGFKAHSLEFWWLAKILVKQPRVFGMRDEATMDSPDTFRNAILAVSYTD